MPDEFKERLGTDGWSIFYDTEEERTAFYARKREQAVADETERCALLCEMRAAISAASAAKFRKEGTYTTRAIWPPFKLVTCIVPRWEEAAKVSDAAAHSFKSLARGIRLGWDPRKLEHDPNERIDLDRDKNLAAALGDGHGNTQGNP